MTSKEMAAKLTSAIEAALPDYPDYLDIEESQVVKDIARAVLNTIIPKAMHTGPIFWEGVKEDMGL